MTPGALRALLLAGLLAAGVRGQADDASCRACHPGPTRGLAATPHAVLLQRADLHARSCTACHGDLTAHVQSARRPGEGALVRAPAVKAEACASCHAGVDYPVHKGAHPAVRVPQLTREPVAPADAPLLAELERSQESKDLQWSGLVAAGYRFVSRHGSRDRYETDLNLDPGARLKEFALEGRGHGAATFDRLSLTAHDIGDPNWDVAARAERDRSFTAGASYRRSDVRYRASGDWHRVDQQSGQASTDVAVDLSEHVRVFADFTSRSDQGFWLTNRIGNRNLTVLSTVAGVQSPRRFDGNETSVGFDFHQDGWRATVAADYLDDRNRDRWMFSQPATANPTFTESEDFASDSSLRGPGGRILVGHTSEPLTFDVSARYRHLDRRIASQGTGSGFDIDEFTSTTTANGDGSARTWLLDGSATLDLSDQVALVADGHWRDHTEDLSLVQTDTVTYPTLGSVTQVTTINNPHTSQRLLEGSLALELSPCKEVDLSIGYGTAHQWLRVPLVDPTGNDFSAGYTRNSGFLASATWRPDQYWTARIRGQDFGQDGVALSEQVEDRARRAEASLGWKDDFRSLTTFGKWRRATNPVSDYRLESVSAGLTGTLQHGDADLSASYVWSRSDTSTLTNFYFDPDPNPVPTVVGFDGITNAVSVSLRLRPSSSVTWELAGGFATTSGSFDVTLLDWRADLRVRVLAQGFAGVEFRQVRYDEEGGADDYGAELVFVYWRQEF